MNDGPWHHLLWTGLAAIAGSITALSFRAFKKMTALEIGVALFVGFAFSIFVGPLVIYWIFGGEGPGDYRVAGGIFYALATGSNVIIPRAVKKVTQLAGLEEEKTRANKEDRS